MIHIALVAGILVMGVGQVLLPTNCEKLTATFLGFFLAMCGMDWTLFHWSYISIAALAFLGSAVIGALFSKNRKPIVMLPNLMRSDGVLVQAMYVGLVLFTTSLDATERTVVIQALLFVAAIVGVIAYWQSNGEAQWCLCAGLTPEMARTTFRSMSTLANPLFLGAYCTLVLPIALSRAATWMDPWDLIVAGLLVYAAIVSGSRATWLGLGLVLPLVVLTHPLVPALQATGIIVLVAVIVMYARHKQQLSRVSAVELVKDSIGSTFSGRRYVGKLIWKELLRRPLFGYGWNSFRQDNPDPNSNDYYDKAHSDILDTAHAVGFVGILVYLAMWGIGMWFAGPFFLAGIVAYFIWSQFGWQHLGPAGVFYTILGLTGVMLK